MWSAEGGGSVHSKNRLVLSRQHRATEVQKLRFLSSCQYTHGCYAPASWSAQHTTVCLDSRKAGTESRNRNDQWKDRLDFEAQCFFVALLNASAIMFEIL